MAGRDGCKVITTSWLVNTGDQHSQADGQGDDDGLLLGLFAASPSLKSLRTICSMSRAARPGITRTGVCQLMFGGRTSAGRPRGPSTSSLMNLRQDETR